VALDLRDCSFFGPALPEPFVKYQLEKHLKKRELLQKSTGDEGKALRESWDVYRRKLRMLGEQGGERRVANHVLEPLVQRLGYERMERQKTDSVLTREGAEDGGYLMTSAEDGKLRCWSVAVGTDLDAPNRRGRAYRFSPSRIAQRVLLAQGERVGLLSNGEELRLLICDPARPDSHIAVALDRSGGWRGAFRPPDSYRLLLALATPAGANAVPELTDEARLAQSTVTDKLRVQARRAVEGFVQALLDHSRNADAIEDWEDIEAQAKQLWREGLILVYRLLFVFKLESSADPARAFSFATTALWRDTYSPNVALAGLVRRLIDEGAQTGVMLEEGLRTLFRMFAEGMQSSELNIRPLGGMLFGQDAIPLIDALHWGEEAVARLLDHLLWTPGDKKTERERVHYGTLDVEDMGRVYEALLELEPGISTESMCRLKRAKLEVVVPVAQGEPYRAKEGAKKSGKTKVEWIEEIPSGCFYLRVGLGRKASGSYYTPHPFVRFLVQETLGPQVEERSPRTDPQPGKLLELTVLDPAMGSGHFLVEACRYLGDALYEACRLCDELAVQAEEESESTEEPQRAELLARAQELWRRVEDLPDPEDELLAYLPSRVAEGEERGLSQQKAEAMCRRLVAVHCLYGVDKNPMAVELAKLSLWLESFAEGLPLTFLDHRLICGDSLTGPFFEHLLTYPGSGEKLDDLFSQGLSQRLTETLKQAMSYVKDLEASVGKDVADLEQKRIAKQKLDDALEPFKVLAAAWSGGVMLGDECDDDAYLRLAREIGQGEGGIEAADLDDSIARMLDAGSTAVSFQLAFPEVFSTPREAAGGFDTVVGNPPWDAVQFKSTEFLAGFDLSVLDSPTKMERAEAEERLLADGEIARMHSVRVEEFEQKKRTNDALFSYQKVVIGGDLAGRQLDEFRLFMERNAQLLGDGGYTGVVVPSAFHANAGATGVRQQYLDEMKLECCFSYENRRKLFDIDSRFKFATVVARRDVQGTDDFECAFYLHDMAWILSDDRRKEALKYSRAFVRAAGGEYLVFPELRDHESIELARVMADGAIGFKGVSQALGLRLQKQPLTFDMAKEASCFIPMESIDTSREDPRLWAARIDLINAHRVAYLTEGKSFWHFTDLWSEAPTYCVALAEIAKKPLRRDNMRFYRLAMRAVASSTNERTATFCLVCPGTVAGHSAALERAPENAPRVNALYVAGMGNTFSFDWLVRQMMGANIGLFVLGLIPVPDCQSAEAFLVHQSLRLNANHDGYSQLWSEEMRQEWREPGSRPKSWPVLGTEDERWEVRAAIDAVVADAYGLDRAQYEHILSTFSHKSYPKAPEQCLAAFDELSEIGLEAFTKKHDPYWDIPLNEELPKPVIDLPIPSDSMDQVREGTLPLYGASEPEEEDE